MEAARCANIYGKNGDVESEIFNMGRIYDAVYGYIELDEVEFAIVNSPIFQRLHSIKQLGPLSIVFPSAQHSRFSHSIGVFHIMKKMIKHLREKEMLKHVTDDDLTCLKLAALLHDVGHVPLSHIGENVLKAVEETTPTDESSLIAGEQTTKEWRKAFPERFTSSSTKLHEALSAEIVCADKGDIDEILKMQLIDWKEKNTHRKNMRELIAQIIVGKCQNQVFRALLHSELDADRLDYLLRDSFFTGVGYGHVDLDYIISRLVVAEDEGGIPRLCLEDKGLHTAEHYILGRFFLQTQVIFYRKVRFLYLVFEDVMKYMVKGDTDGWSLMKLPEFLECIRQEGAKNEEEKSKCRHSLYTFTDAEVFYKMRLLHNELDEKEKANRANDKERYINDCIKIIMDGEVPEPIGKDRHQILISVGSLAELDHVKKLKKSAESLSERAAHKIGVHKERVKANVVIQSVMKYTRQEGEEEESLHEAIRFTYGKREQKQVEFAALSNATILNGLIDKTLLIFNLYYIPSKSEGQDTEENEKLIKLTFEEFISQHFLVKKQGCGCTEKGHLCQIELDERGIDRIAKKTMKPRFICHRCGRVANSASSLCEGQPIQR